MYSKGFYEGIIKSTVHLQIQFLALMCKGNGDILVLISC